MPQQSGHQSPAQQESLSSKQFKTWHSELQLDAHLTLTSNTYTTKPTYYHKTHISNYIHHNSDKKANIQHIHFTNSQFSQRMKDTKNKQSLTTTTITQSTLTRNLTSSAKTSSNPTSNWYTVTLLVTILVRDLLTKSFKTKHHLFLLLSSSYPGKRAAP